MFFFSMVASGTNTSENIFSSCFVHIPAYYEKSFQMLLGPDATYDFLVYFRWLVENKLKKKKHRFHRVLKTGSSGTLIEKEILHFEIKKFNMKNNDCNQTKVLS